MTKTTTAASTPLIKRPLETILRAAGDAGEQVLQNHEAVSTVWRELRSQWLEANLPNSMGLMSDDDFTDLTSRVSDAFDSGIERFLCDARQTISNSPELSTRSTELIEARDDLTCLSSVFGWLDGLFRSIEDLANRDDDISPTLHLLEVKKLAGLGRYIATDWQSTSDGMAEKFDGEIPASEIETELRTTAQAFSAAPRPQTATKKARETENA